jgi:hypothetical protein
MNIPSPVERIQMSFENNLSLFHYYIDDNVHFKFKNNASRAGSFSMTLLSIFMPLTQIYKYNSVSVMMIAIFQNQSLIKEWSSKIN